MKPKLYYRYVIPFDFHRHFTMHVSQQYPEIATDTIMIQFIKEKFMIALERSGMGAQIGNLRVVSPTCADDIAILACSKHEAQALLEIALCQV
jgi:hypothetical protein